MQLNKKGMRTLDPLLYKWQTMPHELHFCLLVSFASTAQCFTNFWMSCQLLKIRSFHIFLNFKIQTFWNSERRRNSEPTSPGGKSEEVSNRFTISPHRPSLTCTHITHFCLALNVVWIWTLISSSKDRTCPTPHSHNYYKPFPHGPLLLLNLGLCL